MDDRRPLRRQDFWTALILIAASVFFLWETSKIPFFRANAAGVESGQWYNSAALVPYGIFATILLLSIALLVIAIRQGGAPDTMTWPTIRAWLTGAGSARMVAVALIMLAYIFALVPRVEFSIASALVLLALIYGFHTRRAAPAVIALIAVMVPAVYAIIVNFPQSRWNVPHDDDWLTLIAFAALLPAMIVESRIAKQRLDAFLKAAPVIAIVVPLFLVTVMAFGFRQNVPNRTGLLFKQIEYHYYVNVRPFLSEQNRR